jgi:hypothetical protein
MIIVQLSGGLGNQLFQYAAGKSLALHHNTILKLDVSAFNNQNARKFELALFNIPLSIALQEEITAFTSANVATKIFDRLKPAQKRKVYKEPHFHFNPAFFQAPEDAYLKGYWQSEKYFTNCADVLRNEFTVREEHIKNVTGLAQQLQSENSISIHIRRGDYLDPTSLEYHGIMEKDYYNKAIRALSEKFADAKFSLFTDDKAWVKENLQFDRPFEIISGVATQSAIEDFYLMSQCRHNIIANSSFSWWAAWLNNFRAKNVIAPAKWFNKAPHDTRDLIPANWHRL